MAAINFPTGASNGTTHYENGKLWTFDGVSWNITAQPANLTYLPNLSTVGIVTSGAWAATAITSKYGGFGSIPIVSKGDILVGSGNTWYNLPYSASNNQVLTVDTSQAFGIKWASVTSSGGAGTVAQGLQYSIPYYPSAGTLITGSSSFTNVGTGISITYTTASTSLTTGALVVSGGIGVGQTSNTKTLGINNVIEQMADTFTTSATGTGQTIHLVDSSVYRTLKYVIQTTSGSDYNSSEILLMHDGSTVYMTEYAQLLAGSGLTLATFDSDISGGKLRLLTSPTNASTSYKFICTALRV